MAFLDNSGDIILDAVLTDTGRMRLAKGDGSFRIAKFALADDEIDYSLYDKTNISGTAYYDLQILQMPILEGFSNNASSMKSKLITIAKNNILYLPIIKVNEAETPFNQAKKLVNGGFVLAVDLDTEDYLKSTAQTLASYYGDPVGTSGLLYGYSDSGGHIRLDQGLDTELISKATGLDTDLIETQYMLEIDNRFATIKETINNISQTPSYIDDDNIATYYFSAGTDTNLVSTISTNEVTTIVGPCGTKLKFSLRANYDVSATDYLFNTIGKDVSAGFGETANTIKSILTNIRVIGVTTGNIIDIPLMVVKKIS